MLTKEDKVRLLLREAEFICPEIILSVAIRARILENPFLPKDDSLRAIFVHIPKSAGTSIRSSLYEMKSFHVPISRYHAANREKTRNYLKFCFVRNPWDRLNSAFHYLWEKRNAGVAFRDHRWAHDTLGKIDNFRSFVHRLDGEPSFCRKVKAYLHFRDQMDWISIPGAMPSPFMDFIGRYENISGDFSDISKILGISIPIASHRIRYDKQDYRNIYDISMIEIVSRIYARDIQALGYDFEEVS